MIREVKFESQDRRIKQILAALNANGIKDIEAATTIHDQMIAKNWIQIGESNIYYYKNVVASSSNVQDVPVFDTFTLKGDAVVANYASAEIIVTAYAVQSDTFNSATDAWTATFGATTTP